MGQERPACLAAAASGRRLGARATAGQFADETIVATPGTTVTVPPGTRHEVTCPADGRLITIFTPGGDRYLAELAGLGPTELAAAALVRGLGERYDIWPE
jgi:YD repeat-containing protein